jgi:FkbM family methyltransferase
MKFYGQGNPPVDKILYESYFKNKTKGFAIECGACDGVLESSCKFFEEFQGWDTMNIEPVPYLYEKLIRNRPNSINVNIALSDKAGVAKFKNAIHPIRGRNFGNGSLRHKEKHLSNLKKQGCSFETFEVDTIDFASLIEEIARRPIDLFVLDVEGHEESVLKGVKNCFWLPKIMCVEHTHTPNLNSLMKDLGYVLDQKVAANSYFIKG